jgi:hypothetical protein
MLLRKSRSNLQIPTEDTTPTPPYSEGAVNVSTRKEAAEIRAAKPVG